MVRVTTKSVPASYTGTTSGICEVQNGITSANYYLNSGRMSLISEKSSYTINMVAPNTGANSGCFSVYESGVESFIKARTIQGVDLPKALILWPNSDGTYTEDRSMYILQRDRWDRDVIMHEYGHFIQNVLNFQQGDAGNSSHGFYRDLRTYDGFRTDQEARNLAFREAWPTFWAISSQYGDTLDPAYHHLDDATEASYALEFNLETVTSRHLSPGQFYESMANGVLWDLWDDHNDAVDNNDIIHIGS